jgi:hypothetical protein
MTWLAVGSINILCIISCHMKTIIDKIRAIKNIKRTSVFLEISISSASPPLSIFQRKTTPSVVPSTNTLLFTTTFHPLKTRGEEFSTIVPCKYFCELVFFAEHLESSATSPGGARKTRAALPEGRERVSQTQRHKIREIRTSCTTSPPFAAA